VALRKQKAREMVQMEQADELVQEPQMAQHIVQNAAQPVCPLERMPGLLIANTS
jgi:hypothetical protein